MCKLVTLRTHSYGFCDRYGLVWEERTTPPAPSGSIPPAMRRALATVSYSVLLLLVLAPVAMAENDGRGFYGATNDKVITEAGFILVIFFPTFALLASLLQRHLERRKDARKAAHKAQLADSRWRGGW